MVKKAKAGKKIVKKTPKSGKPVSKRGTVDSCRASCDGTCPGTSDGFNAGMKEGIKD